MEFLEKTEKILKKLISEGIEFKLHNDLPVIYTSNKVDPDLFNIAKENREGIARFLINEKNNLYKKYEESENTEKYVYKIILEEKFNMKLETKSLEL